MINFQDEINRFKPSLDVENIEEAIEKSDLTDMNDIMMQLMQDGIARGMEKGAQYGAAGTDEL